MAPGCDDRAQRPASTRAGTAVCSHQRREQHAHAGTVARPCAGHVRGAAIHGCVVFVMQPGKLKAEKTRGGRRATSPSSTARLQRVVGESTARSLPGFESQRFEFASRNCIAARQPREPCVRRACGGPMPFLRDLTREPRSVARYSSRTRAAVEDGLRSASIRALQGPLEGTTGS